MKRYQSLIMIVLFSLLVSLVNSISGLIHPLTTSELEKTKEIHSLQKSAVKCGIGSPPREAVEAALFVEQRTGLSAPLLLSLMHTESGFKKQAVSTKNYKGLMQIPHAVYYEDANVLIGARILLEKLKLTGGDYRKAIILYKGWPVNSKEGQKQADKVLVLAQKLREVSV